tara:strand:+ start:157 stop:384 length:228 start_codon:yes stop_codon:yes gene_type:complete
MLPFTQMTGRLSKPLMAVAIIAAFGLLTIGVKPIIEATPAFAQSNQVHKIAICNQSGKKCAAVATGKLWIANFGN